MPTITYWSTLVPAEEQFHRFLTLSNERIARHRMRMIALLDKYFTNPEVSSRIACINSVIID
jgi:hypothetical protein